MTPVQMFIKTRDLIPMPSDWTKGTFEDQNGRLCLYGAFLKAVRGVASFHYGEPLPAAFPWAEELLILACRRRECSGIEYGGMEYIGAFNRGCGGMEHIGAFNNNPATTHADVLDVLDEVIFEAGQQRTAAFNCMDEVIFEAAE